MRHISRIVQVTTALLLLIKSLCNKIFLEMEIMAILVRFAKKRGPFSRLLLLRGGGGGTEGLVVKAY